jgi:hypothetical protein
VIKAINFMQWLLQDEMAQQGAVVLSGMDIWRTICMRS